jgi:acyl-CoA thioester hydrolase
MTSDTSIAQPTVEQLLQLPRFYSMTVPEEYLDEYRHMNVAYYINAWRNGAQGLHRYIGFGEAYEPGGTRGLWLLRQLLDYHAEVREAESVAIHGRIIRHTPKLLHNKFWMINTSTGKMAATSEVLVANADLEARRTTPFTDEVVASMDRHIAECDALGWQVPLATGIEFRN